MIKFENVSKTYQQKNTSILDLNFSIKKGEFVNLIGSSGAGKTTLLRVLLSEEKPSSGNVYFDGVNIHNLRRSDIPKYRQRIGVIFQDFKLLKDKTVYENVAFAMEMIGRSDDEIRADVPHALELVGLVDKMYHFPNQLSGGEQQRLAIARAIINQPDLLIADEPTGSLDPQSAHNVVNILKKINELGTTVILSTHNNIIVDALKKRVIHLEKGKIVRDHENAKYHHSTK
ncbi:MAG: cell division ATP-binding protein FtsE [Candidatus Pacebacteria bacterium]|nr:cell division ATP-binding protein FtsE [Candidatus Paceibacterota bacterium]